MIPAKQRRIIEEAFDLYGRDAALVMDERLPDGQFFAVGNEEDGYALHGSTRVINWARDILANVFVPEVYDEEASTWA